MGLMVLLQGVMLQGAARRVRTVPNSCCKGASEGCCCALQGAVVGFFSEAAGPVANGCKEKSSQNTSSDLANVPRFRIGKFEVWFGYDSGMIRGMIRKPIFFEFRKLCCLSLFFPPSTYYDCYFVNGCNGSTCQTTLDRTWVWRMWRSQCTSMIYIRRPAGVSSGCSSHVPLAQLRLGLCSSSTEFWFGCQPASQPASQPPRASQLRDNDETLCAWRRFANTGQLACQVHYN